VKTKRFQVQEGISTFESLCRFRDLLSSRERKPTETPHNRRVNAICGEMADELIDMRRQMISVPIEGTVR